MRATNHRRAENGVTLLELLIAVSLVAILSTGMMVATRSSLLAYQKTSQRLESNRRVVGVEHILSSQLGAAMAVMGVCGANGAPPSTRPFLDGNATHLRLVSSFSIAEGARGYPQIVEYRVLPAAGGGVRLTVSEHAYTGPESTTRFCAGPAPSELAPGAEPPVADVAYVLADRLAYCRFSYHEPYDINAFVETDWLPLWNRQLLPAAVRIEMQPAGPVAGGLPQLGLTVPLHVTRDPLAQYEDHF